MFDFLAEVFYVSFQAARMNMISSCLLFGYTPILSLSPLSLYLDMCMHKSNNNFDSI